MKAWFSTEAPSLGPTGLKRCRDFFAGAKRFMPDGRILYSFAFLILLSGTGKSSDLWQQPRCHLGGRSLSQESIGSGSSQCPMPELEREINKAYDVWKSNPKEKHSIDNLLHALEKAVPRYNCKRKVDKDPVPAWWLADYRSINNWMDFLTSVIDDHYPLALKPFFDFYGTSDGYIAEEMTWQMVRMVKSDPMFILENWEVVRPYQHAFSGIRYILEPADIDAISVMYDQISRTEPHLSSACLDIIRALKGKWS